MPVASVPDTTLPMEIWYQHSVGDPDLINCPDPDPDLTIESHKTRQKKIGLNKYRYIFLNLLFL